MLPVDQVVFTPSVKAPSGLNSRTVCEMIDMRMTTLFAHVRHGSLPPPDWYAGEMLWPIEFPAWFRKHGLALPGTYAGFLPGTEPDMELLRWKLASRGRHICYTAREKRARAKAAKRGGRK